MAVCMDVCVVRGLSSPWTDGETGRQEACWHEQLTGWCACVCARAHEHTSMCVCRIHVYPVCVTGGHVHVFMIVMCLWKGAVTPSLGVFSRRSGFDLGREFGQVTEPTVCEGVCLFFFTVFFNTWGQNVALTLLRQAVDLGCQYDCVVFTDAGQVITSVCTKVPCSHTDLKRNGLK